MRTLMFEFLLLLREEDAVMTALNKIQSSPEAIASVQQHLQQQRQKSLGNLNANKIALQKKGINVSRLKRIGEGSMGIAFDIGNNMVLKLTADDAEAASANSLKGKKFKNIANVFDAWKFQNSKYFGIVLELVVPFNRWPNSPEKEQVEEIVDTMGLKKLLIKHKGNWEAVWQEMQAESFVPLDKNIFLTFANMTKELQSVGVSGFFDIHLNNLGKRLSSGDIVAFDIGFSKGGTPPPELS